MKKTLVFVTIVNLLLVFSCKDKETIINLLKTEIDTTGLDFRLARFDSALKESRKEGKYLLVYISSSGCGPCIKMERNVFSDSTVKAFFKANFICSKVHIKTSPTGVMKKSDFEKLNETQLDFMNLYDLQVAFPTFVILDNKGTLVKKVTKYMEVKEFIQFGSLQSGQRSNL